MKKIFYITFLSLYCSTLSHAQCTTQAGTLPSDTLFICQNDITAFQHQDAILTEQDALIYVLHEASNLSASLDTLYPNEIEWRELGEINWNTVYEVTAIAGLDENEDGLPDDLNEGCTVISEAMPVVFAAPVSFEILFDCFFDDQNFYDEELCVFKAFSFWQISEKQNFQDGNVDRSYTITHNIDDNVLNMQSSVDFTYILSELDPIIIDFYIQDNYNCIDTLISFDTQYCPTIALSLLDGFVIVTNMPSEQQIVCAEEQSNIFAECVYSDSGTSEEYVLSLSPDYQIDSILATNLNTGSFSISDAQGYTNTELYVMGTLTHSFFGNRAISEPTPIVFLEPITPQINVLECNETTNTATLALSFSGGLPEFNPTTFYSIEGDLETTLQFGESTIIEVPLLESLNWNLDLTVSDENECMEVIEVGEACAVGIEENTLSNIGFSLQNLFPIPAKNHLFLQLNTNKNQAILLQLFSFNGSKVIEQRANLEVGMNELQWSLSNLPTGIYWLQMTGREGSLVEKVMVQR